MLTPQVLVVSVRTVIDTAQESQLEMTKCNPNRNKCLQIEPNNKKEGIEQRFQENCVGEVCKHFQETKRPTERTKILFLYFS